MTAPKDKALYRQLADDLMQSTGPETQSTGIYLAALKRNIGADAPANLLERMDMAEEGKPFRLTAQETLVFRETFGLKAPNSNTTRRDFGISGMALVASVALFMTGTSIDNATTSRTGKALASATNGVALAMAFASAGASVAAVHNYTTHASDRKLEASEKAQMLRQVRKAFSEAINGQVHILQSESHESGLRTA